MIEIRVVPPGESYFTQVIATFNIWNDIVFWLSKQDVTDMCGDIYGQLSVTVRDGTIYSIGGNPE